MSDPNVCVPNTRSAQLGRKNEITVPFRIVRHGLWPVTTAPKFYFGRGQCDAWFWPNFGELKFRPGILKLEFSANALSQPAKDNVTRDTHQFQHRQRGLWPVTRQTIRNGTVTRSRDASDVTWAWTLPLSLFPANMPVVVQQLMLVASHEQSL